MKTTLFKIAFFSLIMFFGSDCNDNCGETLEFRLPFQVFGLKDTLSLGDSIRIKLEIPDKMAAVNSNNVYDFINYNFLLHTYISRIDTLPTISDSNENVIWVTLQGESKLVGSAGLTSFLVFPIYKDHVYLYEVVLVPRQKGLFVFGMNSDAYRGNPLEKLDGPCSNKPLEVFVKLRDDTDSNFEFMKLSPDPFISKIPQQQFEEAGGFCFYVR